MLRYRSNGKLLLTAEYLVLFGAKALAIPTRLGQSLTVTSSDGPATLQWKSFNAQNRHWFDATYRAKSLDLIESSDETAALKLKQWLLHCDLKNPFFLDADQSTVVETHLDFPRDWGLGSSSTALHNLAQWADVDALELTFAVTNGSGYDVAVAGHNTPILYQKGTPPLVSPTSFCPDNPEELFFVHLNEKQNSTAEVDRLKSMHAGQESALATAIDKANELTNRMLTQTSSKCLQEVCTEHELLLSEVLQRPTVKALLFDDYPHAMKSLGAWGGDFILAFGSKDDQAYFRNKGYDTIVSYREMIHPNSQRTCE